MSHESQVMSLKSQVLGLESRVSGLLKKATTFGFASLLLWNHQVGGSCSVKGVIRQHTGDCTCGWGPWSFLVTLPL